MFSKTFSFRKYSCSTEIKIIELEQLLLLDMLIIFKLFHIYLIILLFQESNRTTDLEFIYDDTDIQVNEIAELYSYTEQYELQLNLKVYVYFTKYQSRLYHCFK